MCDWLARSQPTNTTCRRIAYPNRRIYVTLVETSRDAADIYIHYILNVAIDVDAEGL